MVVNFVCSTIGAEDMQPIVVILTLFCRCSAEGSRYAACLNTSSLTGNSSNNLYIPQQDLLDEYTDSEDGWMIWHRIVIIAVLALIPRFATYFTLKYIRKPT